MSKKKICSILTNFGIYFVPDVIATSIIERLYVLRTFLKNDKNSKAIFGGYSLFPVPVFRKYLYLIR